MKVIHISDTHARHESLHIPPCDVLIHSGDIGTRTDLLELDRFLNWFDQQDATHKIWIAGNHDLCLDAHFMKNNQQGIRLGGAAIYQNAMDRVKESSSYYLMNDSCEIKGLRFFGAPWSPSFHRHNWAFNRDPGEEIQKQWSRIPSDTAVLITHSPPFGCLDKVELSPFSVLPAGGHVGCRDLMAVIKKRLKSLQLHCFGHVHENFGVQRCQLSQKYNALFSNGAMLDNRYRIIQPMPVMQYL